MPGWLGGATVAPAAAGSRPEEPDAPEEPHAAEPAGTLAPPERPAERGPRGATLRRGTVRRDGSGTGRAARSLRHRGTAPRHRTRRGRGHRRRCSPSPSRSPPCPRRSRPRAGPPTGPPAADPPGRPADPPTRTGRPARPRRGVGAGSSPCSRCCCWPPPASPWSSRWCPTRRRLRPRPLRRSPPAPPSRPSSPPCRSAPPRATWRSPPTAPTPTSPAGPPAR